MTATTLISRLLEDDDSDLKSFLEDPVKGKWFREQSTGYFYHPVRHDDKYVRCVIVDVERSKVGRRGVGTFRFGQPPYPACAPPRLSQELADRVEQAVDDILCGNYGGSGI